ncbi:MAG: hypothetical protein KKG59_05665 [Nanoarchaeota archaeon]|nr:hypothetical protein [Nanoarchaeota archaeon]
MRRVYILLLVLCLLVAYVNAENVIYGEWHHSGDTFTIDEKGYENDIHYLSYFITDQGYEHLSKTIDAHEANDGKLNKLLWKINNVGFTILPGACRVEPRIKYCVEEINWDDSSSGHLEYHSGDLYPGLNIQIYKVGPDISVTRESEQGTTLNIDEESKIGIKLENIGDRRANDVVYQEIPPLIIDSYSASGLNVYFLDSIKYFEYTGNMQPEDIRKFGYKIKPVSYEEFKIPATLTYLYEGETYEDDVSDLSIEVKTPYEFATGLSPAKRGLNEPTMLTVSFGNDDDYRSMIGTIRLSIPKELDIISRPSGVNKKGDFYYFKMELNPEESYSFEVPLRGGATGSYDITIYGDFDFNGDLFSDKDTKTLEIAATQLNPKIRLIDPSVESGTEIRLVAELENKDKVNSYINIEGVVSGPLLQNPIKVSADELMPEWTEKYVDEMITAPLTNTEREYKFTFTGTYALSSGESFSFDTYAILTVSPTGGDYFTLTQDFSGGLIVKGETLTVKTSVKNLKNFPMFRVEVEDTLPDGINVVAGNIKNVLDLDALETKQVYFYRLEVPESFLDETFPVKTTVKYQEYSFSDESSITVITPSPPEDPPEENATQIPEDPGNDEPDDDTDDVFVTEEKGFFTKFVEGISNFFDNLF